MWHCSISSSRVKLVGFLLADFPFLGITDHLAQVLLLQLTTFPVIIRCRQSPKLSRASELAATEVPTTNDRKLEISQVEDPSGIWNSFIAEEGSSGRGRGTVQYLCRNGGRWERVSKKRDLCHFQKRGQGGGQGIFSEVWKDYIQSTRVIQFLFSQKGIIIIWFSWNCLRFLPIPPRMSDERSQVLCFLFFSSSLSVALVQVCLVQRGKCYSSCCSSIHKLFCTVTFKRRIQQFYCKS